MSITKEVKNELAKTYGLAEGDTGSPEVQIAIWTTRINNLIEHFNVHRKDPSGSDEDGQQTPPPSRLPEEKRRKEISGNH